MLPPSTPALAANRTPTVDAAAASTTPFTKRHLSPEVAEAEATFAKLRKLDPDVLDEDYFHNGAWDVGAVKEDFRITQAYQSTSLEAILQPIRHEVKNLVDATPRSKGPVQVSPPNGPVIILSDGDGARDLPKLTAMGIKRVVNCSPQTVKTGTPFYGAGIDYMELWEDDLMDYCIMQDFEGVWDFSNSTDGATLFHCEQGINRSGCLAVGMCMKLLALATPSLAPEQLFRLAWRGVVERRGKVLTNPSFQRQLLLFAKANLQWFPSFLGLWRSQKERSMARFRSFAERVASDFIGENASAMPPQNRWRFVVFIRDGTMRGELNLKKEQFDLDTISSADKAERRIRQYAQKSLKKQPEKWCQTEA